MLRIGDVVAVQGDWEGLLEGFNEDGTVNVRSETTGKLYKVDIQDCEELSKPYYIRFLNNYQREAKRTMNVKEDALYYLALGLASEAGEVAGKVKKAIRDDRRKDLSHERKMQILSELGDVLWYVAVLADYLGMDLSSVATDNILKLRDRENRGKIGGDGDNR